MQYTKGHDYVKTGRKITVPFLCTSSNDALYLYSFMKKSLKVLKLQSGHETLPFELLTLTFIGQGSFTSSAHQLGMVNI